MEALSKRENVVPKDVVLVELSKFVENWTFEKQEDYKLEESYPQVIVAMMKGLVVFDEKFKPTVTLLVPLTDQDDVAVVSHIEFRTRLKPTDLANITKGLDITKQQVEYTLRCLCYITKKERAYLDKFSKFDYKVIEQIASVFF